MLLVNKIKNWKIFKEIWHEYHNPYYWWWKGRKYFKHPKAHFIWGEFSGYFGMPCRTDSYKGLQFHFVGLGWKSKYNSPRHEWDPVVCITWTNPWKTKEENKFAEKGYIERNKTYWIGWIFNWQIPHDNDSDTASMATWEALLDHVIWKHDIEWCYNHHMWNSEVGPNGHNITILNNIKWKNTSEK